MKKVKLIFAILSVFMIILCSCKSNENEKLKDSFKIIGNVKNIPDSSVVIIQVNNINLDSALVLNEKFELNGSLDGPAKAFLFIPSTNDYKFFWIENTEITFKARRENFFDAQIVGSPLQNESDSLLAKVIFLRQTQDSLLTLLSTDPAKVNIDSILKKVEEIEKEEKQEEYLVVKNNPSSLIAMNTLDVYKTTWGKEKVKPLYKAFVDEIKKSIYGESVKQYLEVNINPEVGDKYADFESTNTNGKTVKLSDIKAKVVLLDFWASWCFPCREENKNLVKVYEDYKKHGFEIFGVSGDTKKESWLEAINKDKLIWTNVFDDKGGESIPFLIYGVNGIPDNFLINSEGVIVARNLRGDKLRIKLDELLQ